MGIYHLTEFKRTMKVFFRPYQRKFDDDWMIYANNESGVSVALGEVTQSPYGKLTTDGQRKLLQKIPRALELADEWTFNGERIVPMWDQHTEPKAHLEIGDLYLTDVATIGGANTGSDGAFLQLKNGKVIDLGMLKEDYPYIEVED